MISKYAQDNEIAEFNQLLKELLGDVPPLPETTQTAQTTQNENSFGEQVLTNARADLGVYEDLGKNDGKRIREYFKYFNMGAGQNWCAAAVSAWMIEAGGGPVAGGVGARNIGNQFAQAGRWIPHNKITTEIMKPGNIAIWARGGPDSWKGHIGVIESFDGQHFTSIEANAGKSTNSVIRNKHSVNDANLL